MPVPEAFRGLQMPAVAAPAPPGQSRLRVTQKS
jgi:hypothetical protein